MCAVFFAFFCAAFISPLFAFDDIFIAEYQRKLADKPVGERIALWAEKFEGVPYDPDPLGAYVTKKSVVADDSVDCMYLSFRAVELAMSRSPEEAISEALDKRFIGRGILKGQAVINYDDRFQYGEDMLDSGKWGREITRDLGPVSSMKGSRGRETVEYISRDDLRKIIGQRGRDSLKDGDLVYFIKPPEKRSVGEIVGHIGIIKIEGNEVYLIHASGRKDKGVYGVSKSTTGGNGKVRKVLFAEYVNSMPFSGIRVGRFHSF